MKAHIIKDGEYKGMKFTKGLVYSVSDPTLAALIGLGIALDTRVKVTVDAKEVKAPKVKEKAQPKVQAKEVKVGKPKVSRPSLMETKEEKHENPIEE